MSDTSFYSECASSGDYDHLINNLINMGQCALINVEYKQNFEQSACNGFKIKSNEEKVILFMAWVFGEITPCAIGTLHQAAGNHYFGQGPVHVYLFIVNRH